MSLWLTRICRLVKERSLPLLPSILLRTVRCRIVCSSLTSITAKLYRDASDAEIRNIVISDLQVRPPLRIHCALALCTHHRTGARLQGGVPDNTLECVRSARV